MIKVVRNNIEHFRKILSNYEQETPLLDTVLVLDWWTEVLEAAEKRRSFAPLKLQSRLKESLPAAPKFGESNLG